MGRFRFRAGAALDLRQRALDEAQRHLARAEGDRDRAAVAADGAGGAAQQARDACAAKGREAMLASELEWYRFWIVRLDHEHGACRAALTAREQAVHQARLACADARRQCRSLEKLRDRLRAAFDAAEAADERKLIDELATRRFVAAARTSG